MDRRALLWLALPACVGGSLIGAGVGVLLHDGHPILFGMAVVGYLCMGVGTWSTPWLTRRYHRDLSIRAHSRLYGGTVYGNQEDTGV